TEDALRIGLVFNHEVSHWNRPRPSHRPYGQHYKRRNVFRFPGTGHTQFSFPSIVLGLNEAAAISHLKADLAASNPLESEIPERPMLVNTKEVAERVGFEPTVGVNLHTLSKRAP